MAFFSGGWLGRLYAKGNLNGINFGFLNDLCGELNYYFTCFLSEFHRNEKLLKRINSTFNALNSKAESPQRLTYFRSVSLVGSLYKVLANMLANRLKSMMGSVILKSHSAFIQGRQILDGILIEN